MTAKNLILRYRRDAEIPGRDKLPGISVLRQQLRDLHLDLCHIDKNDPDLTPDHLTFALGEHPQGHPREFQLI